MLYALPYDALLAVHLLAVAMFLAGLVLTVLILPGLSRGPLTEAMRDGLGRLRMINRVMTLPALLLLWLCGIGMTLQAGWYVTGWLRWKVACAAVLTLIYALQARQIRRLMTGRSVRPARYRLLWLILLLVVLIGILVIAKPF
jgi:protoporphyrinogen IX oxidase